MEDSSAEEGPNVWISPEAIRHSMPKSGYDFSARLEQNIVNLSDQETNLEGQGRAATAAPVRYILHFNMSMSVRMQPPELMGRETVGILIRRFRM